MSIRETMNRNPKATAVIAIAGAALALYLVIWLQNFLGPPSIAVTKVFYTTDDGKTWFADDADKIYPFDHDGKQAFRAYVFKCNHDAPPFVVALGRINEAGRTKLAEFRAKPRKEQSNA